MTASLSRKPLQAIMPEEVRSLGYTGDSCRTDVGWTRRWTHLPIGVHELVPWGPLRGIGIRRAHRVVVDFGPELVVREAAERARDCGPFR